MRNIIVYDAVSEILTRRLTLMVPDTQTPQSRIEQVLRFIHSHLDQPLTVASLATLGGWSRWQFQRVFAAHTGSSVAHYIRELRLSKAAERLLCTPERQLDIALACGFESDISFSRSFRDPLPPAGPYPGGTAARATAPPLALPDPDTRGVAAGFRRGRYVLSHPWHLLAYPGLCPACAGPVAAPGGQPQAAGGRCPDGRDGRVRR